jgi:hypothetical protein
MHTGILPLPLHGGSVEDGDRPNFRATRFAQLKPGELFLVSIDSRYEVARAAADPYEGDRVAVLLGPGRERAGHIAGGIQANVLSLGSEYELRLPTAPSAGPPTNPHGTNSVSL